jgi:hypothetical protein
LAAEKYATFFRFIFEVREVFGIQRVFALCLAMGERFAYSNNPPFAIGLQRMGHPAVLPSSSFSLVMFPPSSFSSLLFGRVFD